MNTRGMTTEDKGVLSVCTAITVVSNPVSMKGENTSEKTLAILRRKTSSKCVPKLQKYPKMLYDGHIQ